MGKQLNCPNCGAPISGPRCEYCGTKFNDYIEPIIYEPTENLKSQLYDIIAQSTYESQMAYLQTQIQNAYQTVMTQSAQSQIQNIQSTLNSIREKHLTKTLSQCPGIFIIMIIITITSIIIPLFI